MKKSTDFLKTHFIAHRGLHTSDLKVPENSTKAIIDAYQSGYAIEFDVQMLKDQTLVVFHDNNLKRMCDVDVNINTITKDDLKKYPLLNSTEIIPTLANILKTVNGQVPLLIELKSNKNIKLLTPLFNQMMASYQGTYAVFSFHPYVAKWYHKHNPSIPYGIISSFFKERKLFYPIKWYLKSLFSIRKANVDFISYNIKDLPNKYLDKYYKNGKTIISYTANSQEDLDYVKKHYDNVVFQFFTPKQD